MLCLLAPELILWLAVVDLCKARLLQREFQKIPTVSSWTIDHGFVLTMGGFTLKTPSGDRFRPSIQRFLDLLKSDEIEGLEIAKEDIEDKAIANAMIKLLAVLQILWFACNVIGRAVQHLPITTLELFTCAIIFCSLLTYMCWWYKPYDFERPFCLKTTASIGELEEATKKGQYYKYGHVSPGKRSPLLEVELDLLITTWQGSLTMWTVGAAVALSFGPWHLLGWNFYFNTEAERFLWQLCSLCCIALPFVIALIPLIELVSKKSQDYIIDMCQRVVGGVYVCFRLYLIVESVVGLRAVPVGVYKNLNWARFIPHVGT